MEKDMPEFLFVFLILVTFFACLWFLHTKLDEKEYVYQNKYKPEKHIKWVISEVEGEIMYICPNCWTTFADQSNYCPECGARVTE